ncbi:MAG: OsmC family protein [Deinococcota bacterium]|jgi:osmotically inducible protein OsmC|nr:OsmC family protein [Deinococcota bacterium]
MAVRTANAEWNGSLKEGKGKMKLQSGAYEGAYSYASRFETGAGTNPEELIGAAHAGCFSMKLSGNLGQAGYTPDFVKTEARVHLENGAITTIELRTEAKVPGIDESTFKEEAEKAKSGCPVSKSLSTNIDIKLEATLVS